MLLKKAKIAIVEDNLSLRDEIQFQLNGAGFKPASAGSAGELDQLLSESDFDIVILDIGLPGEDGLSIAKRLRQTYSHIGIIMLTAMGELDMRLNGFENGIDFYMVKPVDIRELIAHINVLIRRLYPEEFKPKSEKFDWQLKSAGRELVCPNDSVIQLTSMESLVLKLLVQNVGKPVERALIISEIAGQDTSHYDPHRLEACVSRLRQKLINALNSQNSSIAASSLPLKTVRGVGYLFSAAVQQGD